MTPTELSCCTSEPKCPYCTIAAKTLADTSNLILGKVESGTALAFARRHLGACLDAWWGADGSITVVLPGVIDSIQVVIQVGQ